MDYFSQLYGSCFGLPVPPEKVPESRTYFPDPSRRKSSPTSGSRRFPDYSNDVVVIGHDGNRSSTCSISFFNRLTGHWSTMERMERFPRGFQVVAHNRKLYILGGYGRDIEPSPQVLSFDCDTKQWRSLPGMPTRRLDFAAGMLNGFIYVSGGRKCFTGPVQSSVDCFDIANEVWFQAGPMNIPRSSHKLLELKGALYVLDRSPTCYGIEKYDPGSGRWQSLPVNKILESIDHDAIAHRGKIYGSAFDSLIEYDPETDIVNRLPGSNEFLHGSSLVSVGENLWSLGGRELYSNKCAEKFAYEYDFRFGRWRQMPDMDMGRAEHFAFAI